MPDSPFTSLDDFVALPRITALALSADGSRLIATVAAPNEEVSKYASALWEIDPAGRRDPVRLTFSAKGETGAAFLPDGALLFASTRPDDGADDPDTEDNSLWRLPPVGEATVHARTPGGLTGPVVATAAPVVVLSGSRLAGSDGTDDGERRKRRKDTKSSGILHDGMPIRYWDSELGETSPRLFLLDACGDGEVRDLAPDAGAALHEAAATIARTSSPSTPPREPGRSCSPSPTPTSATRGSTRPDRPTPSYAGPVAPSRPRIARCCRSIGRVDRRRSSRSSVT